ncbi:nuclear transport factor 2 family protein [Burkholderia cenocepacia]|uniref:nuclear transport factor 2 family protein n=1 Tax=Burkholderia cenocepacia TaxID=95486 RepID=UPI001F42055D|nr:nuclear transport factor 2 family protein [Burkholderia cenocepacia]
MPDLHTLSDHHDIRERVVAYSSAIDSRDFDALDTVFTPDAAIDCRAMGGIAGRYPDVKARLRTVLMQHHGAWVKQGFDQCARDVKRRAEALHAARTRKSS